MKKTIKILLPLFAAFNLGADINGGDLVMHDLQSRSNDIQVPADATVTGCGEPPSGYFIWFDGDDPYAGGVPSPAATWTDKGRESRVMSNDDAGKTPTLNTGYFSFDGTDDYFKSERDNTWSELFGGSTHFCMHLVRKTAATGSNSAIWGTWASSSAVSYAISVDTGGTKQDWFMNNGNGAHINIAETFSEPIGSWYVYGSEYDKSSPAARVALNGSWSSPVSALSATNNPPLFTTYTYNIGAISPSTSYAGDTSPFWEWYGDIAQIICYDDLTKEAATQTWIDCKKDELAGGGGGA